MQQIKNFETMKIKYLVLNVLLFSSFIQINAVGYYFYVQFKDKNNTTYSLSNPSAFLSQRALDRRTFFNVAIDSTDLPVNQSYISQIQALNVPIHSRTKWINGVTVVLSDSSKITDVQNLSCVKFVQFTGRTNDAGSLISRQKFPRETSTTNYGYATTQINQINGSVLHDNNYRGQGMVIAVIDAGFYNANNNPGFDSLRNEGRLLGVKNFVDPNISVYNEHSHGSNVLSFMAGNIPTSYVGTAPKASYWLLQSEANNTESLVEPDLWVSAIEFADSVGADVSTTSLGYTTFNNSSLNFTYADLDGKTARASIAATMAVDKGIMVLNSAGNDGTNGWHYVGVPADAAKIITVGAVFSNGSPWGLSSYGPTPDGRLKPELSAMGSSAAYINTSGTFSAGNGTSYSCPILAGMTTCFLQAVKEKRPNLGLSEIKDMMYRSANLYATPSYQMGYGIPNFLTAYNELLSLATSNLEVDKVKIKINSNEKKIFVQIDENISQNITINLYNLAGSNLVERIFNTNNFDINSQAFQKGMYILNLNFNGKTVNKKIIL